MSLRLRREALAALTATELAAVVAGDAPPTRDRCVSNEVPCELPIDWETSFCPTER